MPKKPKTHKVISIWVTPTEHNQLTALSKRVDIPYSSIVRKLVAAYATGEVKPASLPVAAR